MSDSGGEGPSAKKRDISEDEDDFEERPKKKVKKSKKPKKKDASMFLELEAEVDDDEDEDDYDEAEDGFSELEEDVQETLGERARLRSKVDGFSKQADALKMNDTLADLERRYGEQGSDDDDVIGSDEEEAGGHRRRRYDPDEERIAEGVDKASLLPTVRDPKLWMVRCKPGAEKQLCIRIMNKFFAVQGTNEALKIKSVVAPENVKGYIYIESDREQAVRDAVYGLRDLFAMKIKIVPIKEMTSVLEFRQQKVRIEKGMWVRCRTGAYKGDIGRVYDVEDGRDKIVVQLIPRIDYQAWLGDGKKLKTRPPQKLFNVDEFTTMGGQYQVKRNELKDAFYVVDNSKWFKDGFLFKDMKFRSIEAGVQPTLDEIQRFRLEDDENEEAQDITQLSLGINRPKATFHLNDSVRVISGDLKNLIGRVSHVDTENRVVRVKPDKTFNLKSELEFSMDNLQKYFKVGDHVKVVAGTHKDETGMVERVDSDVIHLLTDLSRKEISVFVTDIIESSEVAKGLETLGNYGLFDLVQLDPYTVGVVVRVESESFQVLDNTGKVKSVLLTEMGAKKDSKKTTLLDAHQNTLSVNDVVTVLEGDHKGRQGTVKHLFRSWLWLHSRDVLDNNGLFVARNRQVEAQNKKPNSDNNMGAPGASGQQDGFGMGRGRGAPRGGMGAGRGGDRGKHMLADKTVRIIKGPYKGFIGLVKNGTETHVRIELHAKARQVTVPLEMVKQEGAPSTAGRSGGYGGGDDHYHMGAATPMHSGAATPMWRSNDGYGGQSPWHGAGSRTPMRDEDGSRTPMRDGSRTPLRDDIWNPNAPQTPARDPYQGYDDDPRTPGGFDGQTPGFSARTPGDRWNPNQGATPYGANSPGYGMDRGAQGAPTPGGHYGGWDHGGGMSAHTPGMSAPTPGMVAHTPGMAAHTPGMVAPTPGGMVAPTPGMVAHTPGMVAHTPGMGAPTPGMGAPTPGPYSQAHTPGMGAPTPGMGAPTPGGYDYGGYGHHSAPTPGGDFPKLEEWCSPNIVVAVEATNEVGVVVSVDGNNVNVNINGSSSAYSAEKLKKVDPAKNDLVRILRGDAAGKTGKLVGVDSGDGIVQMDVDQDIKIIPIEDLGKLG